VGRREKNIKRKKRRKRTFFFFLVQKIPHSAKFCSFRSLTQFLLHVMIFSISSLSAPSFSRVFLSQCPNPTKRISVLLTFSPRRIHCLHRHQGRGTHRRRRCWPSFLCGGGEHGDRLLAGRWGVVPSHSQEFGAPKR